MYDDQGERDLVYRTENIAFGLGQRQASVWFSQDSPKISLIKLLDNVPGMSASSVFLIVSYYMSGLRISRCNWRSYSTRAPYASAALVKQQSKQRLCTGMVPCVYAPWHWGWPAPSAEDDI